MKFAYYYNKMNAVLWERNYFSFSELNLQNVQLLSVSVNLPVKLLQEYILWRILKYLKMSTFLYIKLKIWCDREWFRCPLHADFTDISEPVKLCSNIIWPLDGTTHLVKAPTRLQNTIYWSYINPKYSSFSKTQPLMQSVRWGSFKSVWDSPQYSNCRRRSPIHWHKSHTYPRARALYPVCERLFVKY